jgi:hypothetical protein
MTTITLNVPDELAGELAAATEQLPQLLLLALQLRQPEALILSPSSFPAFTEMIDFLASSPTAQEIIEFKVSPTAQARLEELLHKNRENQLSPTEASELDTFQQINHIFILLKARARASSN